MTQLATILTLATLAELLIEVAKPLLEPLFTWLLGRIPQAKRSSAAERSLAINPYLYLSLLVGVGLAFNYDLDLIAALDVAPPTAVGTLITGALLGRGSNFIHDVIARLTPDAPRPTPHDPTAANQP